MLSDISSRLMQVIELKRRKEKLERDLSRLDDRLAQKSTQASALEQQLKQEQVDVERLERLSLKGLFYSVLGSKVEQLDKERQELLAVQLKYQQAKREVETYHADREQVERELRALSGVEREYAALLTEKENLLRQSDPRAAAELMRLSEEIANRKAERQEIDEALAAAKDVLGSLNRVNESLESAEGWGTWDMLGGGFLATAVKHSRIDDARDGVQDAQAKMARFQRELADVQRSTDIRIDIGELEAFADFFFDGLIMDWIVQSKIANSLEQSRQAKAQVEHAAASLRRAREASARQMEILTEQRRSLVEGG